jgi:EEF1A lysine methyltransferase 2
MTANELQRHWDAIYEETPLHQTGWYEASPEPSLRLLDRCEIALHEPVVDAGAGASTFIDALLERGYLRVIAVDISAQALDALSRRLGVDRARVEMVVDDLTRAEYVNRLRDVALWHDRAVLHFFTDPEDRAVYVQTLRTVVRPGGYVILATFSLDGAEECSGLPVVRYDATSLAGLLGDEFELVEAFDHTYLQPSGDTRPFVYTLFRRR